MKQTKHQQRKPPVNKVWHIHHMDSSVIINGMGENAHNTKLNQRFSSRDDSAKGHSAMWEDTFGCHDWGWGATGI